MTQTNNERELIERLALVDIDLRRSHNGFDFIASLSELEAFAKAYKTASDEKSISQNEQQEAVAYIYRNEYNEYRLEPADNFNIKTIPMNEHILLYKSPPKQAIPEDVIKDAERYNWLKQNYHGFEMFRHSTIPYVTLDREVDKAMLNSAPTNAEVGE